jgi:iron complex transport system substrate-binding protein
MKTKLIFLLCCGLLWACGDAQKRDLVKNAPTISVKYTDATGREVVLQQAPRKIISLAPNITEMIFAVGAEEKLAAVSQACNFPPETFELPRVTTYPEVDREQLKSFGADMLITTDEIFGPQQISLIEEVGLPVYLQSYDSLASVYRSLRTLGEILGQPEKGQQVADSLQELERRIVAKTSGEVKYNCLVLISSDPLKVVGGEGFLHELIQKAGGKNVFAGKEEAYPTVTVEEILAAEPEYLLLPSTDDQVYADLISLYPTLTNTPADRLRQVFILDPDLLYRPGPRMLQGLLEMTVSLHSALNSSQFFE